MIRCLLPIRSCYARSRSDTITKSCLRSFAVKSLSWCSPSDTPKRSDKEKNTNMTGEKNDNGSLLSLDPIDKFGVVAAMARSNRVMGVNGKLPWNLPEDRKHFVDLTRDKVLIMGRRTFEEQPSRSHICHAANNIVVSSTMEPSNDDDIEIARSFPEALHLAKKLVTEDGTNDDALDCWVVGGERIFTEALNHPSAKELHLTIVDMDVDTSEWTNEDLNTKVALFPAKYRWDRHFYEVERTKCEAKGDDGSLLRFEHVLYRRKH